jgi:predicted peptidase
MELALLCACLWLLTGCTMPREPMPGRFVERALQRDGATHRYQVFVPSRAAYRGKPALVLFLHGSGERGHDNQAQLDAGLGPYLKRQARDFPALVVLSQVPGVEEWTDINARVALAAQQATLEEFGADPQRV